MAFYIYVNKGVLMARKCSVSYGNGLPDMQYYIQSNEKEITVRHTVLTHACKIYYQSI